MSSKCSLITWETGYAGLLIQFNTVNDKIDITL